MTLSQREQGFDSPWDYQTETRALRGFLRLVAPRGIEVTDGAQVGPGWDSPGGCSDRSAAGGGPCAASRAAGASPRRRSRRGDAEGFPADQPAMPPPRGIEVTELLHRDSDLRSSPLRGGNPLRGFRPILPVSHAVRAPLRPEPESREPTASKIAFLYLIPK